jgi:hypothetical protein
LSHRFVLKSISKKYHIWHKLEKILLLLHDPVVEFWVLIEVKVKQKNFEEINNFENISPIREIEAGLISDNKDEHSAKQ